MKVAKVTFQNDVVITTSINGTEATIKDYYKEGRVFNIGTVDDDLQPVKNCEVLPCPHLQNRALQLYVNYTPDMVQSIMYDERNTGTTIDDIEFTMSKIKKQ